jgi:small subunit ribosomal protein S21
MMPTAANRPHAGWTQQHKSEGLVLQVFVRDNNVDQALRVLKKKMQREGLFREMKRRRFYEKPSEKTTREKAEAIRRARKQARKQAQREGLIAPTPKKEPGAGKAVGHRPLQARRW